MLKLADTLLILINPSPSNVKDYIEDLEYLDDLDLECIKRKKRDISFKTGKKPYGKGLFSKRIRW